MRKTRFTINFSWLGANISEELSLIDEQKREEELEAEESVWSQHVLQDARGEASKKSGSLTVGNAEVQLKRLSDQMSREAQEERERKLRHEQEEKEMMAHA